MVAILRHKTILIFFILLVSVKSFAQVQVGIFGGLSNYQGDLTDKPFQNSKGSFALTLAYQVKPRINLRAGLTIATIAGADSLSDKDYLRQRNLSFQSPITELSFTAEFYTFDLSNKRWSPYVFAGLALFHFNPYTFNQSNSKVYLKPLSTEGEGLQGYPDSKPYSLTQLAIPFGGGFKFVVTPTMNIAIEAGLRKTFTDYLDDVSGNYPDATDLLNAKGQQAVLLSYRGFEVAGGNPAFPGKGAQRGSPKSKDYYYFTGIHLSFSLGNSQSSGAMYFHNHVKKGYGCPANPL
jgi:hypothetical protein